jgi:hypothetical protein
MYWTSIARSRDRPRPDPVTEAPVRASAYGAPAYAAEPGDASKPDES